MANKFVQSILDSLKLSDEDDFEELEAIQTTQQILTNFLKTMELFNCDEVILGTFLDNILLP